MFIGGGSQVRAINKLLGMALKKKYDRYIYISGQDYPIWTNEEMTHFWIQNQEVEYCGAYNITDSSDAMALSKINHYSWFDIPFKNEKLFNKSRNLLNSVLRKIPRNTSFYVKGREYKIYWGSSWWSLSNECARYVYKTYNENAEIRKYLRYSFAPDELWVQTILGNSQYKERLLHVDSYDFNKVTVLQLVEYRDSIKIWEKKDYDTIKRSDKMFLRKVTTEKSKDLLDLLDFQRQSRST